MWQIVFCSHRALSRLLTHMRHGIPFPFSCLLLCSLPSCHDRAAASAIREVGRGISNCLRWLCDHHEEEGDGDGDDDGNVAALSDPVSAYGRQIVCAICALQLSAPAPAQIVYDAFELCFKKKSQKKTRNRRDVIAKDDLPPWWGEADRKRWQVGANVRGEKCVYCKNQLLWIFEFVKSGLATG